MIAPVDKALSAERVAVRRLELPNGHVVEVREDHVRLPPSERQVLLGKRTYDIKPQLALGDESLFPELAIVRLLQDAGWAAVWMDSFHYGIWDGMPPTGRASLGDAQAEALSRIAPRTRTRDGRIRWAGCWDVLAWSADGDMAFIESKGAEPVAPSQLRFLEAALASGVPIDAFSVVAWDLETRGSMAGQSVERPLQRRSEMPSIPNNHTLPRIPLEVSQIVGDLSRCQVFAIVNPEVISRERPSRVRNGIEVNGREVLTAGNGVSGQATRTTFGDAVAREISQHLPADYDWPG